MKELNLLTSKENYIPTLNKMGYTTTILCSYTKDFIKYSKTCKKPVADIGIGLGYSTRNILKAGRNIVYANDLEPKHLNILQSSLTEEQRKRLILLPGKVQDVFKVSPSSIAGILAARVFHFLSGDEIEHVLDIFYRALIKNGKLFITVETPYIKPLTKFLNIYQQRQNNGDEWPGVINNFSEYTGRPNTPSFVNVLEPDILERVLKRAGFKIERIGYFDRPYFPIQVRNGGRESVGIVGVKC